MPKKLVPKFFDLVLSQATSRERHHPAMPSITVKMEREVGIHRWLGDITILGGHFHVDAIRVTSDGRAASAQLQPYINDYYEREDGHQPSTVMILGYPHAIFIYPFTG